MWSTRPEVMLSIRPLAQQLLRDAIASVQSSAPEDTRDRVDVVVHFRCGDVPFERHPTYKLLRYAWYRKVFTLLQDRNRSVARVYVMQCAASKYQQSQVQVQPALLWNLPPPQYTACREYTRRLVQSIQSFPGVVEAWTSASNDCLSRSVDDDFILMATAPNLVSTGSSMSFMAGLAVDGTVVVPHDMSSAKSSVDQSVSVGEKDTEKDTEKDSVVELGDDFLSVRSEGMRLEHDDVPDYYDVRAVHAALAEQTGHVDHTHEVGLWLRD